MKPARKRIKNRLYDVFGSVVAIWYGGFKK